MPEILLSVLPVILICSLIQSIFGVGLLIFGTPSLLLMGIPFSTALLYLVPSSLVISFCQVWGGYREGERFPKETQAFLKCSLPFVLIGLLIVLAFEGNFNIKPAVGFLLLLSALFRLVKPLHVAMTEFVRKQTNGYLAVMGLVHGLSNMGGGLLTILANTLYSNKRTIRFAIAGGYLVFAIMQLILVLFYHGKELCWPMGLLPLVSLGVYFALGSRIFKVATEAVYQHLMTVIILFFGISLLVF